MTLKLNHISLQRALFSMLACVVWGLSSPAGAQTLLNVSYDVSREFFKAVNAAFVANHKKNKGGDVKVDQSHGGYSAQARAVNDGLEADVFISWENEAHLLEKEFGSKVDIVYPSISILAEPPVTVVDKNFYRPINEKIKAKYEKSLPKLPLFTIEQAFGGWDKAAKDHFADGAVYDQIFQSIKR